MQAILFCSKGLCLQRHHAALSCQVQGMTGTFYTPEADAVMHAVHALEDVLRQLVLELGQQHRFEGECAELTTLQHSVHALRRRLQRGY
jgi:hypothetical protein